MSNTYLGGGGNQSGPGGGASSVAITVVQNIVTAINSIAQLLTQFLTRTKGSFTLAAAASTVVTNTAIPAGAVIVLTPTNAAAGTLQGSAKCLYVSAVAGGSGFTVATASGAAAVGTETFSYVAL